MAVSDLRLIKHCVEFLPQKDVPRVPRAVRGIYVLYEYRPDAGRYDVVYIGMVGGLKRAGIGGRLRRHRSEKGQLWTHFSGYAVWDNISETEIKELEGLFRHIYRKDTTANRLNVQKGFSKLRRLRDITHQADWLRSE